jgi:transposase
VRRLDRELDQAARNSSLWREKEDLLRSVLGVGKVLCLNLLAHLPEFGALIGGRLPPWSAWHRLLR